MTGLSGETKHPPVIPRMPNWPWKSRKQCEVLTGVGPRPKVLQVKWQSDAPAECQHLSQRPHADRYFPLTPTRSRTLSTLGLIARFSASHCVRFSAADSDSDSDSVLGGTFGINTSASELSSTFVISILWQAIRRANCSVKGLFTQLHRRSWYSSQHTRAQHVPEKYLCKWFLKKWNNSKMHVLQLVSG